MRNGVKIGWITDNHFFNSTGKKLGYTTSDSVFDTKAKKMAHLSGEYVYITGDDEKMKLEKITSKIEASALPNIQRLAIKVFFGD